MTAETSRPDRPVDVAFITVNYNTRALLEELVRFFRETPLPFTSTFTVVDNASSDGSPEFIGSCDDVRLIRNSENLGYGRAMNLGIAASSSRYLCLINTDVILNAEALVALVQHCDSHPDVAVCTPVIRYPDGRIQGFFFKFGLIPLYFELYKKLWNRAFKARLAAARSAVPVDGIAGAFIFCRAGLAEAGRLFDEEFFFYYEDTELAHRLLKQGRRCEVLPRQSIVHIGGQSSSVRHIRLFYGSRYRYLKKQYGNVHMRCVFLQDVMRVGAKLLFYRAAALVSSRDKIRSKLESYGHAAMILEELRGSLGN